MATTEDIGLSLSDWVGIGGALLTLVAIPLGLIGAHFHSAVRNDDARTRLIERLTTTGARDAYHERLGGLLQWLDEKIGPPPFASHSPHGRRLFGLPSLSWCVIISLAYSIGSWLAGWAAGAPDALGDVTLMAQGELPHWMPAWTPPWSPRLLVVLLLVGFGVFVWWYLPRAEWWADRIGESFGALGRRVLGNAGATVFYGIGPLVASAVGLVALAVALAGAIGGGDGAFAGAIAFAVAGAGAGGGARAAAVAAALTVYLAGTAAILLAVEVGLIGFLFWLALPWLNGFLDWISLSVSRWLGRAIMAERDSPKSVLWTLALALADLLAAVAFAFGIAWLLAFGVEASATWSDLSLGLESYIEAAAEAPWTTGFWATFMVLSTLVPTAIHFVLAVGALLMAWSGNPLRAWAAKKLQSPNEADWLGPQLYLTFGWLVPTLLAPAALIWLIAQVVGLIEPLPDALRDTGLHGIATAQAWLR